MYREREGFILEGDGAQDAFRCWHDAEEHEVEGEESADGEENDVGAGVRTRLAVREDVAPVPGRMGGDEKWGVRRCGGVEKVCVGMKGVCVGV